MTLRRWNIVPMGTCPRHWGSGQLPARKTVTGQWWALWYQSLQDRSFPKDHTPGKWNLSSMKECEWWNQCSRQFLIIYVHGWRHKGGGPNGQRRSIGKDGCSKCLLNNPSPSRGQMASGYAWSLCGYLSPIWLGACPITFTAVADALEWIVKARGVRMLWHYLDDFITACNWRVSGQHDMSVPDLWAAWDLLTSVKVHLNFWGLK